MRDVPQVVCVGMSVADVIVQGLAELPDGGRTAFAKRVSMSAGGDALNEAVVLSRLGHKAGLVTLVGDDGQGRFLLEHCRTCGVDVRAAAVSAKYPTSTSVVILSASGERSFISQKNGTVDEFGPEHVDPDSIGPGVRVVSIGSMFCSPRFDRDALPDVLGRAKRAGAVTVADFVLNRAGAALADCKNSFPLLDYAVPSMEEAAMYTGRTAPDEIAGIFFALGVANVIIKMGADGVYFNDRARTLRLPAYRANVVDTTGAGDNFVAGFISGLLQGLPPEGCLRFAGAAAAVSIGAVGACAGVESIGQVRTFIEQHS